MNVTHPHITDARAYEGIRRARAAGSSEESPGPDVVQLDRNNRVFGILGGMGALASAEFLKTIYEDGIADCEQNAPRVLLYSDPTFPDRTEAFLSGQEEVVLDRLIKVVHQLRQLGASVLVLCCVTMHYLVPRLPVELRGLVISVLDVLFAQLKAVEGSHLLICSRGSRNLRLFQKHAEWGHVADRVVLPDEGDQERIHRDLIYPVKRNADLDDLAALLSSLVSDYRAYGFIVGCSELHVIAKHLMTMNSRPRCTCVDPFMALAGQIRVQSGRSSIVRQGSND